MNNIKIFFIEILKIFLGAIGGILMIPFAIISAVCLSIFTLIYTICVLIYSVVSVIFECVDEDFYNKKDSSFYYDITQRGDDDE